MADLSIMNALAVPSGAPLTMSSREIAELVGLRHDNVKRTIETLIARGTIGIPQSEEIPTATKPVRVFLLEKRSSLIVVAQLSPEFTARIVDRWQELEDGAKAIAVPQTLAEALRLAADLSERHEAARAALAIAEPKAAALDRIATASGSTCITNAAKDLQMAPRALFAWLSAHRWIYRRVGGKGWVAYQDRIQSGHLEHKVALVDKADGTEKAVEQVLVTPKGLALLGRSVKTV